MNSLANFKWCVKVSYSLKKWYNIKLMQRLYNRGNISNYTMDFKRCVPLRGYIKEIYL